MKATSENCINQNYGGAVLHVNFQLQSQKNDSCQVHHKYSRRAHLHIVTSISYFQIIQADLPSFAKETRNAVYLALLNEHNIKY